MTPLEDARRERDEAQAEARRLRAAVVLLALIAVCALGVAVAPEFAVVVPNLIGVAP